MRKILFDRATVISYLIGLTFSLALIFNKIFKRFFDYDEFEHLQFSWLTWSGYIPYKDFFEHHSPLLAWLFNPIFYLLPANDPIYLLTLGRIFILPFLCLSVFYLYKMINQEEKIQTKIALITIFLSCPLLVVKGLEFRPDNIALAFWFACIWHLHQNKYFKASLLFSLCLVITSKYIILLPIIVFYLLFSGVKLKQSLVYLTIMALMPILTSLYFSFYGEFYAYWYFNYLLNFNWPAKIPSFPVFLELIKKLNLIIILVVFSAVYRLKKVKKLERSQVFNLMAIFYIFVSLFITTGPSLQYSLVLLPFIFHLLSQNFKVENIGFSLLILAYIVLNFSLLYRTNDHYRWYQEKIIKKLNNPNSYYLSGNPIYPLFHKPFFYYPFINWEIIKVIDHQHIEKIKKDINEGFIPDVISLDRSLNRFFTKHKIEILKFYNCDESTRYNYLDGKYHLLCWKK